MSVVWEKTLKTSISCTGIGLHSGERVEMTLLPAGPGMGIRFRRVDLDGPAIEARHDNVSDTLMNTSLANHDGRGVATIEHLMAAIAGLGIDNLLIELDGGEVPAMDGSAAPFVFLVECAGLVEQQAPRNAIEILKTISVIDGDSQITLSPSDGFSIAFEISFNHPTIADQSCFIELGDGVFKREVARARTFGFLSDINKMRENGLGLGGSLDNAVVLSNDGVMNDGGLRYVDEFVRHKALDCIGDLYLIGAPLLGHVQCTRSGHATNHLLRQALFDDESAWRYITLDNKRTAGAAVTRWRCASVAAPA